MKSEPISNWWRGSEAEWERIPFADRMNLAFKHTGCEVAWPRWQAPVDCLHTGCRIRRGELLPIAKLNGTMRYERECGWWRFIEDRTLIARMYRHYRREARKTDNYDLWKLGGAGIALVGVLGR